MSLLNRNPHEFTVGEIENLSHAPAGGVWKMWLAGFLLALGPTGYGFHCLMAGKAVLPGRQSSMEVTGPAAIALGVAYIAIGAFLHFHYFWGLHRRLLGLSPVFKLLAVLVFLGSFGYALVRIVVD